MDGLTCFACGYDLRRTPPDGLCPECGLAVGESQSRWREAAVWLPRLRAACRAFAAGGAVLLTLILASMLANLVLRDSSETVQTIAVLGMLTLAMIPLAAGAALRGRAGWTLAAVSAVTLLGVGVLATEVLYGTFGDGTLFTQWWTSMIVISAVTSALLACLAAAAVIVAVRVRPVPGRGSVLTLAAAVQAGSATLLIASSTAAEVHFLLRADPTGGVFPTPPAWLEQVRGIAGLLTMPALLVFWIAASTLAFGLTPRVRAAREVDTLAA